LPHGLVDVAGFLSLQYSAMHRTLSGQTGRFGIIHNLWTMTNQALTKWELPKGVERLLVALLLAVFLVEGGIALCYMSSTGDETHYLGMGRYLLKHRTWDLDDALLQPPLSYYLHSVPLLGLSIDDQLFKTKELNERGRALMGSFPDDRLLMLARMPILLLATGLGFLVFFWSKQVYGSAGGLLALFLYAFHPVIIGNSVLITPDLCLTAFSTLTMYFFWRYRNAPSFKGALLTGGALGLTLLSKYSAILLVVGLLFLVILFAVMRRFHRETSTRFWQFRHLLLIFVAALLVVNAGYLFTGSFQPLKGGAYHSALVHWFANTGVLRSIPMPLPRAYVLGMDLQHSVIENGFICYLMGITAQRGWIYYYIVAFFLKAPVVFIVLLLLTTIKGRDRLQWMLLVPIIIFPLYFSVFRLSRGVRYILPIYPLLCIWIGQLALLAKGLSWKPLMKLGVMLLLAWYAAGSVWIAPHYTAYVSEIAGGPDNGLNLLFESDFDWGQDLKGLSSYLNEKKIDRIKLGYFSTADAAHYGVRFDPLPCETPPKPQTGLIAASATALQVWGCYDWLKNYKPVDKVGYTIFIYNIPSRNVDTK
jgi:hypothetical protein